jgi:anti-sigma factor RsiW
MTGHLDADALADLEEGLLDRDHVASARAHVAGCPQCRAELAALTGVRERLAAASDVGPMPADVVARLDRALAEVATEPASTAVTRSVIPLREPQRSSPRGLRWLQAAAVVVLFLAGGAVAVSALRGADNGDVATSSGTAAGKADQRAAGAAGSYPVTASGRHWTKQSVTAEVPELLAGTLSPTLPPSSFSAQDDTSGSAAAPRELAGVPAARLAGGPALADCVTELAGGPATPLAVDLATFDGQPAAVVLLPGIGGPGRVDVWVVPPDCAQGKGQFLYYANVARP